MTYTTERDNLMFVWEDPEQIDIYRRAATGEASTDGWPGWVWTDSTIDVTKVLSEGDGADAFEAVVDEYIRGTPMRSLDLMGADEINQVAMIDAEGDRAYEVIEDLRGAVRSLYEDTIGFDPDDPDEMATDAGQDLVPQGDSDAIVAMLLTVRAARDVPIVSREPLINLIASALAETMGRGVLRIVRHIEGREQ